MEVGTIGEHPAPSRGSVGPKSHTTKSHTTKSPPTTSRIPLFGKEEEKRPKTKMALSTYLRLQSFRRYLPDWLCTFAILIYFFFVAEHAKPFNRQFKLSDPTIQHPFAVVERVSGPMCLLLAAAVPLVVMTVVTFVKHKNQKDHAWHVLQVSLLGVYLTVLLDGVITDILKGWVGRPRPDFLARCGPKPSTPLDTFVDISVCTGPLGPRALVDGMRSTPSGHSSISFSAFLFLSMWLFGQLQLLLNVTGRPVYLYLFAGSPLVLASYVALSRTQDYRHHFVDIFLGGILGCFVAVVVYRKFFHSVIGPKSHEILGDEEQPVLPV